MSADGFLSKLRFLRPLGETHDCREETVSGGWGEVRCGQREWEDFYRRRWQYDKRVRSTHGVNCTGSCSWDVYVKNGIIVWETQRKEYPSCGAGYPNHEPRGCPRGATYSWYTYSPVRLKHPLANGAGKSSLFKLITGEHSPEKGGAVIKAKGVTVGYLSQHPEFEPEKTALALALEGNLRMTEIENELQRIESKLGSPEVYNNARSLERLLDAQHKLLEEYESLGGLNYTSRVRELLHGLGLPESDFEKPIRALSGGQKKLIGLARLMLARPAVLLLDEPDNHLDMPGKAYLEKLIVEYPGAVVIISHDRYILDAVATHIAEIEDGKIITCSGNYTEFILDTGAIVGTSEKAKTISIEVGKGAEAQTMMVLFDDRTKGLEFAVTGEAATINWEQRGADKFATTIKKKLAKLPDGVTEIGVDELHKLISQKTPFTLADARPKMRYDQAHLPGAINIPVPDLKEKKESILPKEKDKLLVSYCGGYT